MQIPSGSLRAYACMAGGKEAPDLSGVVKFYETKCGVLVMARIFGLPGENSVHGFHIHEGKDCGGEGFRDTGGHFNPTGREHPYHAGDLPPLFACNGQAYMTVLTGRFRVQDVIGRTVVIHAKPDDMHTQPSGNSGDKIGCGVIRSCGRRC